MVRVYCTFSKDATGVFMNIGEAVVYSLCLCSVHEASYITLIELYEKKGYGY